MALPLRKYILGIFFAAFLRRERQHSVVHRTTLNIVFLDFVFVTIKLYFLCYIFNPPPGIPIRQMFGKNNNFTLF